MMVLQLQVENDNHRLTVSLNIPSARLLSIANFS